MLKLSDLDRFASTGGNGITLREYAKGYSYLIGNDRPISLRSLLEHLQRKSFGGQTTSTIQSGSNPCAKNVLAQLSADRGFTIKNRDWGFSFDHPAKGPGKSHIQGVARLRDWNGWGRMVVSDNITKKGFHLAFQPISGADEGVYSHERHFKRTISFDIRNVIKHGKHDHPGGMQAQGDFVAIAMESAQIAPKHAAIYFLKVTGDKIEHVNTHKLDGSQDELEQDGDKTHAATVGFVRLNDLHYLLAVAGKNHGRQGIWFYKSDRPSIEKHTKWKYLSFYKPEKTGFGTENDNKYAGAGGGLNFVTDCSGELYLLAMHGTSGGGKDYDYLQVFHVTSNKRGEIQLEKKVQHRDNLGRVAVNNISFRWSAGLFVSNTGQIALMSTERRFKEEKNRVLNGAVHLGKMH